MNTCDVIIPCYNYGRFLQACVDSVLGQPGCDVRVLVIDDASADDSFDIGRGIAERDARVRAIKHLVNQGHIATYNEGIDWVSAEYMLLLSADDLLAPGALSRAVGALETHPNLGLVYGRATKFSGEKNEPQLATAIQKRIGGYRPDLPHSGDLEMWLRFAANGDVGFIDAVQAFTRIHTDNMRNVYLANSGVGDYTQRFEALRAFFTSWSAPSPELNELSRLAYQGLSEEAMWDAARAFDTGESDRVERLAAVARRIYPGISRNLHWWTLSVKRLIGPRRWPALARPVEGARRLWSGARRSRDRDTNRSS
jgi:glycosyltransferase involved in cell wall biosynthesis